MKRYLMMKLMRAVLLYKTDNITFWSRAMTYLTLLMVLLKLFRLLPVSWWLIFSPLYAPLLVFMAIDGYGWVKRRWNG